MTNLQSISETLDTAFCERNFKFYGIVEVTKSRNGADIVDVLRKVEHERRFDPVVWDGHTIAFITLNEITYDSGRNGKGEATLTVISKHYGDHKLILANLERYEVQEARLTLDSQGIYDKYFVEEENRPFQGFAFEIKFDFSDSISLCCESFEKKCN